MAKLGSKVAARTAQAAASRYPRQRGCRREVVELAGLPEAQLGDRQHASAVRVFVAFEFASRFAWAVLGTLDGHAFAFQNGGRQSTQNVAIDQPLGPIAEADEERGPADLHAGAARQHHERRQGETDGGARGHRHGHRLLAAALRIAPVIIVIPALPGSPKLPKRPQFLLAGFAPPA